MTDDPTQPHAIPTPSEPITPASPVTPAGTSADQYSPTPDNRP